MRNVLKDNRGLSLIELVVTLVILSILASVVLPSAQITNKRIKEIELRANLRTIRTAIDEYRRKYERAVSEGKLPVVQNKTGCPETLEVLVEGDDFGGLVDYKEKFLRNIPRDPFHPVTDENDPPWGLRSYTDEPDSTNTDGKDVYNVYSLSEETAIDGTKYKDW